MELLVTMSMSQYEELKKKAEEKSNEAELVERALYWAIRSMDDHLAICEFNAMCRRSGIAVTRSGTIVNVEKL